MNVKSEKHSLAALYFIYFCEYFIWGCTITFAAHIPIEQTSKSLIWTMAVLPIGQLIGFPLLGDLSDWVGRKKILLWTISGSILCLIWAGFALYNGYYTSFLAAEFFVGFFTGKLALVQASIGELQLGSKPRKFAILSLFGGLPCLFGPFIGSFLFSKGLYYNPSLFGSALFILAFFGVLIYFRETYQPHIHRHLSVGAYINSFGKLFDLTWKERFFSPFLLNLMGWYLTILFLAPYLLSHLQLFDKNIEFYNMILGVAFTLGGILGAKWIFASWRSSDVLKVVLIIFTAALLILFTTTTSLTLWPLLTAIGLSQALIYPAFMTILSDHATPAHQGKLFGLVGMSNGVCHFVALGLFAFMPGSLGLLLALIFVALSLYLFKHRSKS